MSLYFQFPAIEDYPVVKPIMNENEQSTAKSAFSTTDIYTELNNEQKNKDASEESIIAS
ncbi:hypothetical protein [Pedobacter sp. MW01-1-1]|uniref:hypothetical protein n=1 Tax=Pedobacter sp. MW01-1-1 TaxID=3383027 RepID=UPI003FF0E16F